jgi:hypothetical protein
VRLPGLAISLTFAATACGSDGSNLDTGPAPTPEATQLAFTVEPASAVAGQAIAPPIEVSIQDSTGTLFASDDQPITLALESNPTSASLSGTITVKAEGGVASFSDLTISKPGAGFALSASAPGLTGAHSAAFKISPVPGLATTIVPVEGDGQTTTVNRTVPINPSVRVTDGLGDPVANIAVTFSVLAGQGTITDSEQVTNSAGLATVGRWTLGVLAQVNSLIATSPALPATPVTFYATALAEPAATLKKFDGDDEVASPGNPVVQPPSVYVSDRFGNPVAGVAVTFEVTSGGGSVTGATQTSGTDGVARVGSWTLGKGVGPNTLRAAAPALDGSPRTFTARASTFPISATVEVRDNYFLSMRNGSGANPGFFGSIAVDTIAVGGTVTWQWVGQSHNVTDAPSINSGTHSAPFSFGPLTFDQAGDYFYRCTIHSSFSWYFDLVGMRGRIVVR